MTATIESSHDYACAPADLWALVTDFQALAEVCKPLIAFAGLPQGRCEQGMTATVDVRLFGILPPQPYAMKVIEQNDTEMWLRSYEQGAGVKSWRHKLRVTAQGPRSRLTDHIEIDAGFLTPLVAWWGRNLYAHRHKRRLRLLGEPG